MNRFAVVVAMLAGVAWGDIPHPDSSGCRDKAVGAACKRDDGSEGGCVKATCSRNDYSNGPPPTQVSYECLKCDAAALPEKKQSCATMPAEGIAGLLGLLLLRRRAR